MIVPVSRGFSEEWSKRPSVAGFNVGFGFPRPGPLVLSRFVLYTFFVILQARRIFFPVAGDLVVLTRIRCIFWLPVSGTYPSWEPNGQRLALGWAFR